MKVKKRFILLIVLTIFFISSFSFFIILNYLNPFEYKIISIALIIFTFILSVSSFFCVFLYFFKKIYYRWEVFLLHVLSSFRQWFFISLFLVWLVVFRIIWVNLYWTWFLLFILLLFLELLMQNLEAYKI